MKDNRSYISKKYAALKRYYMWYCVSKKLDLILVSEFPKSGGTWYCQMLSDYLQLPYPRNRTPRLEKNVLFVKYENLFSNAEKEMTGSIIALLDDSHIIDSQRLQKVIQNNSFENLSKRKKGEENKTEFLRKGIAGDWKIYFSKEACQLFDYFGGNELINLGYEFNHDWYNNLQ